MDFLGLHVMLETRMCNPEASSSKTTRTVVLFAAECASCASVFPAPCLGDFAYGEFIFFGERGTVYVYLNAFSEPAWEIVCSEFMAGDGEKIQSTVAAVADTANGQRLCASHVCPVCYSRNWTRWGELPAVGRIEIGVATFVAFNALSVEDQRRLIRSIAG